MNISHLFESFLVIMNQMSPYILLGFLIAGLLHVFVRPEAMSRHLSGPGWKPVVKAALFGIPLPLCSCGVLPTAVGLKRQGASNGATTSFLIATPQTGVDSIAATYSLLGLPFAIIRPIAALAGAFAGGMAVSKYADDEEWHDDHCDCGEIENLPSCECGDCGEVKNLPSSGGFFAKLWAAVRYGLVDMVASVGKWLVIGLVVAALITVFVPDSLFVRFSEYPLLAMLVVVAVAVPMYICATGSIPIALSLMMKGLSPGIAFVMLMAGPAANFASVMILSRTQGKKATFIYVASVVITAIAFGLAIDLLMPASWFAIPGGTAAACCHDHATFGIFDTLCSVFLGSLLVYAFVKQQISKKQIKEQDMSKTYKIGGMNCPHCQATVQRQIASVEGVENVIVDLSTGTAHVEGNPDDEKVAAVVRAAGFEFLG